MDLRNSKKWNTLFWIYIGNKILFFYYLLDIKVLFSYLSIIFLTSTQFTHGYRNQLLKWPNARIKQTRMNLKGTKKVFYLSRMPQNCFYHKIAAYVISRISVSFFFLYLSFWEKYVGKGRFFCILLLHVWVNTWLAGDHIQGKTHIGALNFWSLIQLLG